MAVLTISFLVVGNLIGVGILALPINTGLAGLIPALGGMIVLGGAMFFTALVLAREAVESRKENFNLPSLYRTAGTWKPAKDKAGDLLLVEGTLDALGAACLGWAAVALLTRPQAGGPQDRGSGAAIMLEAHLPALRALRLVRVVPDADPGEKGAEGERLAAKLVAWLRAAGCRAEVSTLADLLPDLPPTCKDLADAAKHERTRRHE